MSISELKLLRGDCIDLGICKVYQPTVNDITDLGEEKYNQYLSAISIDKNIIFADKKDENTDNITNFELAIVLCYSHKEFADVFLDSFSYFLKEIVYLDSRGLLFIGDIQEQRFIDNNIYEQIIKVIKLQNCILKEDSLSDDPANDKARELLEKRRKAREKVAKLKNKGEDTGEPLTMGDLVSILCANGNGVNYQNVWDMPIYMFNNQFNRMKMLEDYDINIRSLLAGAKGEDIELKHWMTKIK